MPRVAVDILTPKQALLFKEVTRFLEENGADVHCTTRRYFEVEEMLRRLKLRAAVIGSHGGASLRGKLVAHADRLGKMSRFYSRLKPDLVVSFSSPEAARAAFGLSIPHLTVNDSPHAAAVAKLSVPLSSLLLTPWIIPRKEWTRYGIEERKIVEYRALDPASWLKKFKPSKSALDEIGLEIDRPILTVRPPEYLAAYMLGKGDEAVRDMANAAKRLLRSRPEFQVVVLSRYGRASKYRKMFGKKAFVTDKVVDGKSLLKYSTLFIGAGGTMTAEAALLGVPTISVFPGKTLVEEYLVKEGLVAKADKGLYGCILRQIEKPKDELRSLKKKASAMLSKMEDPAKRIAKASEAFFRR